MKDGSNPSAPSGTSRILVVDDNAPGRYALSRTLRKDGFEVLEAATGEDALAVAERELPVRADGAGRRWRPVVGVLVPIRVLAPVAFLLCLAIRA